MLIHILELCHIIQNSFLFWYFPSNTLKIILYKRLILVEHFLAITVYIKCAVELEIDWIMTYIISIVIEAEQQEWMLQK